MLSLTYLTHLTPTVPDGKDDQDNAELRNGESLHPLILSLRRTGT